MLETVIGIALGVIVGLSVFTALTVTIMLSPVFMKWYTKRIMVCFGQLGEMDYEDLKKEVDESE